MSSMASIDLNKVLFLDIETVPLVQNYEVLPYRIQKLWDKKAEYWVRKSKNTRNSNQLYGEKAAIYAEFGRVVCISAGFLKTDNNPTVEFKIKSWYGQSEKKILAGFSEVVRSHFTRSDDHGFCGHNIKEFDIPYLCRRMLVHGVAIPDALNVQGKKPWEVVHLYDTMEMWKFGDYKNYTSLDLLAAVFEIPSPKEGMDGSKVADCFYEEKWDEIVKYCENDVLTVLKIYLRLLNLSMKFEVIHVQNERYD